MSKLNYDHDDGKRYCEHIGLKWDFEFAQRVDTIAHEQGITQEQFDTMVREHAWRIKVLFSPRAYSIYQRVVIALHFLNPLAKKDF